MDWKISVIGDGNQFYLPGWPGVNVILRIPAKYGEFYPDTNLSYDALRAFEENPPLTPGIRPFSFFKIKNENNVLLENLGDNHLILQVRYTPAAWDASAAAGGGKPLIYFREFKNNTWGADWVPITVKKEDVRPPDEKQLYGTLTAFIDFIPDPAIGGC